MRRQLKINSLLRLNAGLDFAPLRLALHRRRDGSLPRARQMPIDTIKRHGTRGHICLGLALGWLGSLGRCLTRAGSRAATLPWRPTRERAAIKRGCQSLSFPAFAGRNDNSSIKYNIHCMYYIIDPNKLLPGSLI